MSVKTKNNNTNTANDTLRLLVVDDEPEVVFNISEMLEDERFQIINAFSVAEAKSIIHRENIDIILTDITLGDGSGIDVHKEVINTHPDCQTIFMTGNPSIENGIRLMRSGACDYLPKPFGTDTLILALHRTEDKIRLARENIRLRELMSFYNISEATGKAIEDDKLLELILQTAIDEFKADTAGIYFENINSAELETRAFVGNDDDSIRESVKEHCRQVSREVIETSSSNIYNDPEPDYASQDSGIKSSICQPLMAKGKILGTLIVVRTIDPHPFMPGQLAGLGFLASKAAAALENSKLYDDLKQAYVSTVEALANAIEARDSYTRGHTERVYQISLVIADELCWGSDKLGDIRFGGLLHDIGKIAVPDSILNKPGPLTPEESEIIKRHPEDGARIVESIPFLRQAIPYIVSHHERYDGKGYPKQLKGDEIPYQGRLLAVVDTIDAYTTDRPYRKGRSLKKAISEINKSSGTQFHPEVVEACVRAFDKGDLDFLNTKK